MVLWPSAPATSSKFRLTETGHRQEDSMRSGSIRSYWNWPDRPPRTRIGCGSPMRAMAGPAMVRHAGFHSAICFHLLTAPRTSRTSARISTVWCWPAGPAARCWDGAGSARASLVPPAFRAPRRCVVRTAPRPTNARHITQDEPRTMGEPGDRDHGGVGTSAAAGRAARGWVRGVGCACCDGGRIRELLLRLSVYVTHHQ